MPRIIASVSENFHLGPQVSSDHCDDPCLAQPYKGGSNLSAGKVSRRRGSNRVQRRQVTVRSGQKAEDKCRRRGHAHGPCAEVARFTLSDVRAGNRWSLPARGKSCSIGGLWRRAARSFSGVTTGLRQFSEDSARYHGSRAPSSYATLKDDDENPADRYRCVARCLFTEAAIAHPIEGVRARLGPLPGCHNFVVGTLD